MAEEDLHILMEAFMKESGEMTRQMDRAIIIRSLAVSIWENGLKVKRMGKELRNTQTEIHMKDSFNVVLKKVRGNSFGKMAHYMMVNSRIINKMVMEK